MLKTLKKCTYIVKEITLVQKKTASMKLPKLKY